MVRIDIRSQDLKIIKEILKNNLPANTKVWVFGSRAKGTSRPGSDLDLVIQADPPLKKTQKDNLYFQFEDCDLPYKVDLLEDQNLSVLFKQNIDKDKQPLFFTQNLF